MAMTDSLLNTLVVGVEVEGVFKGYPLHEIELAGWVVNDTVAGKPIVVVYNPIAKTGLAYERLTVSRWSSTT